MEQTDPLQVKCDRCYKEFVPGIDTTGDPTNECGECGDMVCDDCGIENDGGPICDECCKIIAIADGFRLFDTGPDGRPILSKKNE